MNAVTTLLGATDLRVHDNHAPCWHASHERPCGRSLHTDPTLAWRTMMHPSRPTSGDVTWRQQLASSSKALNISRLRHTAGEKLVQPHRNNSWRWLPQLKAPGIVLQ